MKSLFEALIVTLAVTAPAAAQQLTPLKEVQLKSGTFKVKAGAILMATGVFLVVPSRLPPPDHWPRRHWEPGWGWCCGEPGSVLRR